MQSSSSVSRVGVSAFVAPDPVAPSSGLPRKRPAVDSSGPDRKKLMIGLVPTNAESYSGSRGIRKIGDFDVEQLQSIDSLSEIQMRTLVGNLLNQKERVPIRESRDAGKNFCAKVKSAPSIAQALRCLAGRRITPLLLDSLFEIRSNERNSWIFKKALYTQCTEDILEKRTYDRLIKCAHKAEDMVFAGQVYLKSYIEGKADKSIFDSYLHALRSTNTCFDRIKLVVKAAGDDYLSDKASCMRYMTEAENAGDYVEAIRIFRYAADRKFLDGDMVRNYIEIAMEARNFSEVQIAFYAFLETQIVSPLPYNFYIPAASVFGYYPEAQRGFHLAVTRKAADTHTFAAFFKALAVRFQEVESGEELFQEGVEAYNLALQMEMASGKFFGAFIGLAGKAGRFEEARASYDLSCKKNMASAAVYLSYLKAIVRSDQHELFVPVCYTGIRKRVFSPKLCAMSLRYARDRSDFSLAREVFNYANSRNQVNEVMFRYYFETAVKTGNLAECKPAFAIAVY